MPDDRPCVLLAPDKFKGTLRAAEVAAALARGIHRTAPGARILTVPVADGGDGTVDAAVSAGWSARTATATGPLGGPAPARWALRGTDAVLELAETSGLQLLAEHGPDHDRAGTRGLGELMALAIAEGARHLLIGIGGSAGSDLGAGLLQGLGAALRDGDGRRIPDGLTGLRDLATADLAPAHAAVAGARLTIASDVTNPLLGPDGAAAVYGPQKGLDPADVPAADEVLAAAARVLDPGGDLAAAAGAGAAGGAGFALLALGARMRSGAEAVLEMTGFADALTAADLLVTGEGRLDAQTLHGKGPAEVARRAHEAGVPVLAVAGEVRLTPEQLREAGIGEACAVLDRAENREEALREGARLLERIGEDIGARLAERGTQPLA